jgi:uncharacterized membrane protein
MSDPASSASAQVPPAYTPSAVDRQESLRLVTIIAYALFLALFVSVFFTSVAGVILAYIKRGDARGTIYESHLDNLISVFWVSLVVSIVALPLLFIGIGFVIYLILVIWYLYRTIMGLIQVLDGKAFA